MIRFRTSVFHLHKRFLVSCWGFDERASVPWRPRLSNDASSITIVAWSKYLIARNWNQLRANVTRWLRRNLSAYFKSFSDAVKRAFPDVMLGQRWGGTRRERATPPGTPRLDWIKIQEPHPISG